MSVQGSPDIITDGLVLCLDAGNTKSYPGTGDKWYDLSGYSNHATLSGTTLTTTYGPKGFYFSGTGAEYISGDTTISFGNNWTYEIILRGDSDSRFIPFTSVGRETINTDFGYESVPNNKGVIYLGSDFSSWQYFTLPVSVQNLTFISLQVTMSNGTTNAWFSSPETGFYQPVTNTVTVSGQTSSESLFWGRYKPQTGYDLKGAVYITRVYNRTLTPSEVLQNYNATKSRFGL